MSQLASATQFQHPLDRSEGLLSELLVEFHRRFKCLQAIVQFLQCVQTHVGAGIAAAAVESGHIDQGFGR